MKVKDCMCGDICVCTPDNSVCDCAKIMSENHIGCIPVCNIANNVVGIITDRDIVLRCIANEKDIHSTKVGEIMSNNICCCKPEQDIKEAEKEMCETQIRRIPVINDNNEVIGMLSLGDLAKNKNVTKEEVGQTVENICDCNKTNIKNCE